MTNPEKKIEVVEGAPVKSVCANPCFACGTAPFPTAKCVGCGTIKRVEDPFDTTYVCDDCAAKFPASLLKSVVDYAFDYALQLRSGEVIRFQGARLHGEFVHLNGIQYRTAPGTAGTTTKPRFPFDRGLDVRVADIVWCADAPEGS